MQARKGTVKLKKKLVFCITLMFVLKSRNFRENYIERLRSQKSVISFCISHGINISAFSWWKTLDSVSSLECSVHYSMLSIH